MTRTITITTTKRGMPALWECGGGFTSHGRVTVIAKSDGSRPKPVYVPTRGHLACGKHALIVLHEGFWIITASTGRRGACEEVMIQQVERTSVTDVYGYRYEADAVVSQHTRFSAGEWDTPLPEKLQEAVAAAVRKAAVYHCREPYYIDTAPKRELTAAQQQQRQQEIEEREQRRAQLRAAKDDADRAEKDQQEQDSREARRNGLGARLQHLQQRAVEAAKTDSRRSTDLELGESRFTFGRLAYNRFYTEANVVAVERDVQRREEWAHYMEFFRALMPRAEALGVCLDFPSDPGAAHVDGAKVSLTADGLAYAQQRLDEVERAREQEAERAREQAEKDRLDEEGRQIGLPADIRIWHDRGGRTNCETGWVISSSGQDRPEDRFSTTPRLARYRRGRMVWDQIRPGELVLRWRKSHTAGSHECEVLHRPDSLTEPQRERVAEIEQELERVWAGSRGLSSGDPSPSIGQGWGLSDITAETLTANELHYSDEASDEASDEENEGEHETVDDAAEPGIVDKDALRRHFNS